MAAAAEVAHGGPIKLVLTGRAENHIHGRQDLADWLGGMEQRRPYLENAIKLCPESDVTRKAKGLLHEAAAN